MPFSVVTFGFLSVRCLRHVPCSVLLTVRVCVHLLSRFSPQLVSLSHMRTPRRSVLCRRPVRVLSWRWNVFQLTFAAMVRIPFLGFVQLLPLEFHL